LRPMWHKLASFILKNRLLVLISLIALTGVMGVFASKVEMSYEYTNAIPKSSQKFKDYQNFKNIFGNDGNLIVVGCQKDNFFEEDFFNSFRAWTKELKKQRGVEQILTISDAVYLKKKADLKDGLEVVPLFKDGVDSSSVAIFKQLPFYEGLLYNKETNVYLTAIYMNPALVDSEKRLGIVDQLEKSAQKFAKKEGIEFHYSGLPYIRTRLAESVKKEMGTILIFSLVFTALILLLFFRSFWAMVYSMLVVIAGVIWAVAFVYFMGYKITLLTALIPPLLVVVGLPNCIYFLNKYHSEYAISGHKEQAISRMVERMGIVTLFTNLTTMVGFGVFYFTQSQILKEFGLVAGLSIFTVFIISLFALPAIFSFLKEPKTRHTKYLKNKFISKTLARLEHWAVDHPKYTTSAVVLVIVLGILGMLRLEQIGFIVDDLPKDNKIYTDLKFFEKHFQGIMPLEILIDTKKKNKAVSLKNIQKLDEFISTFSDFKSTGKALSYIEALKFVKQAYYDGDPANYAVPNVYDISFIAPYLKMDGKSDDSEVSRLMTSFVDSNKQIARISLNMADVGSKRLPIMLSKIKKNSDEIFDKDKYNVSFTGTSVVFLEGSKFIIDSLQNSILLALVMIFLLMFLLFRNWKVVLIALAVNSIPLVITAGLMGWFNIPLKPSTVLVFSIALGIAIDVTIRFLVNYRQDLPKNNYDVKLTVSNTIKETGVSILFTSFILAIGFVVFLSSQFDGTKFLGLLTSLTLVWAMLVNLTFLPILLNWFDKPKPTSASEN